MILRPRQKLFVERCGAALQERGNTLGVAPTGAGKTVMFSAIAGDLAREGAKALVLQHRDELTDQNEKTLKKLFPRLTTSRVNAADKDFSGGVVYAMAPTLAREGTLDRLPALDALVIDEAHHAAAPSYRRIIDRARTLNSEIRIFGVTATPSRSDGRGLRQVFDNIGDQIRIGELVRSGHLVRPRTFVIDVGTQEDLSKTKRTANDFDMKTVAGIMNKSVINAEVVAQWKEKAGNRQTVVFCSTVDHARAVRDAFQADGVATGWVHGNMPPQERTAQLGAYADGETQVIVNVAVLTEGWDHPPTSCVILLRPSSHKSTMIQMIGRGLRMVDPARWPGAIKTDCVILDFGISSLMHGSLEQRGGLGPERPEEDRDQDDSAATKSCPDCSADVPASMEVCEFCGFEFEPEQPTDPLYALGGLENVQLTEIDLLQEQSNFLWTDLFDDGASLMATGFQAWAGCFEAGGVWHAVGGARGAPTALLQIGEQAQCLAAANDYLDAREDEDSAHKSRGWIKRPATEKQIALLPAAFRSDFSLTRYRASALLSFQFNKRAIKNVILGQGRAAA